MIGRGIRYIVKRSNRRKKQLKETECYEQGIKGRHLKGSGCWKCRGEAEHSVGATRSVPTSARTLAMERLRMCVQDVPFLISESRRSNGNTSVSNGF